MSDSSLFSQQLKKYYLWYTGAFVAFLLLLAMLEQLGLHKVWIGYAFMLFSILLYAGIGIMSRTVDVAEYYVAGRRVPAMFNGMATGADWMSAASFISLAGGLLLQGFEGLAYIMGWTGGYCLVAFLLAPYLRKFGQFTIPDFLGARYEGNIARSFGVFAAIICSFTYVIAQIYGVGLITARFTGLEFQIGVFVGLAGILVCSFLGGMRAVTWTQVAQYIILVIAYLIPVIWLSVKHTGIPIPQLAYGGTLEKITAIETKLINDPKELEVRAIHKARATALEGMIATLPKSWEEGRENLEKVATELKNNAALPAEIKASERALAAYPKTADEARRRWTIELKTARDKSSNLSGMPRHAEPFPGKDEISRDIARKNFLALVLCLMLGTAALPHILMRYYTTPTVSEARKSVFWSLLFIFILYFTAPALAVLVKYDIFTSLIGAEISKLPAWVAAWQKVDAGSLLKIVDLNKDGLLQLGELTIGADIVVLATPEIAGLPYVISGLVAAGGLAAALSTADGLLLTIANALSHDTYYKMIDPNASTQKRVTISKILLLIVALIAAYVTSLKPGGILFLVAASFSLAASSFFPALVLGIFWKRANKWGAICGMLVGFLTCVIYMVLTYPFFGGSAANQIWDIAPISAGVFGVPAGLLTLVLVSLLTAPPDKTTQELVEYIRYPNIKTAE